MTITRFAPQTKPTAAQLNAISTSQATIYGGYIGAEQEFGGEEWTGGGQAWGFLHLYRWLIYQSTGALVDPTGINSSVTLAEDDELGYGILDLDTVDWLAYGAYYEVTGVNACVERRTPSTS